MEAQIRCLLIDGVSERINININQCTSQFHTTTYIFPLETMSRFLPEKEHMREALLFCFNLKKSAVELHQMLGEACGDSALSEITCKDWFRWFKDGNFDLSDKKRENCLRKVEDHQLQALLDEDDTLFFWRGIH